MPVQYTKELTLNRLRPAPVPLSFEAPMTIQENLIM
jgi:hypothetical protein